MRAVDERQPLLRAERHRGKPRLLQRRAAGHPLALVHRLALADQREREMGQRGEITTRADGAALGDDRGDARVEHADQQLDHRDADARMATRQAVRQQQHHRAHGIRREWFADAAGMAANQVALKLGQVIAGDFDAAEVTKSGRDTIDGAPLRADALDKGTRRRHTVRRIGRQAHPRALTRDRHHIAQRETRLAAPTNRH